MSQLRVDEIVSENGISAPLFPEGASVTGVLTATSFSGDGSQLSGIDLSYTPNAGIATYADNAGIATFADTAGVAVEAEGLTGAPNITIGNVNGQNGTFTGNIIAVNGEFSGDVSVAGTITHEDVTDINSVGIITAEQGINVVAGGISVGGGVTVSSGTIDGRLGNYSETVNVMGDLGATPTIDYRLGTYVTATLDQTAAFSFTPNPPSGVVHAFGLQLTNGTGGPFTITWPASVKWPGGTTTPRTTTDGRTDMYSFITTDGGTTWFASISQFDYN